MRDIRAAADAAAKRASRMTAQECVVRDVAVAARRTAAAAAAVRDAVLCAAAAERCVYSLRSRRR